MNIIYQNGGVMIIRVHNSHLYGGVMYIIHRN